MQGRLQPRFSSVDKKRDRESVHDREGGDPYLIPLFILPELYAAENTTVVYGMEGETISINCTYGPKEHKWKEKSWCKQVDETQCQRVVSARRFWLPFLKNRNGTTSISDNIHKGVLMVTIKRLQKQDAGLYQCKTDFLGTTRTLQKVKVEVLEGRSLAGSSAQQELMHYFLLALVAGANLS